MDNQYVIFSLGAEDFGVNIAVVESIIKMQPIVRMPHAPSFVEGVTSLRGKVLPVIDLRRRFELAVRTAEDGSHSRDNRIIVVNINQTEVGMIVDGVSEVLTIPSQQIEPAPALATSVNTSFINGIARLEERLIILLDLARILSTEEEARLPA
jgi:purine-binding chemotaxis protein CheW